MQPRLTHVPPRAASSATATRAPRCAAMRAARTPPLPAPMMKRSNAASLIRGRRPSSPSLGVAPWATRPGDRRRSCERLAQQLGNEAVDAFGVACGLLAQPVRQLGRQLAGERHQAGRGVDAALLAPIDDLARALAESPGGAAGPHLPTDLLA